VVGALLYRPVTANLNVQLPFVSGEKPDQYMPVSEPGYARLFTRDAKVPVHVETVFLLG
jgi:hypothetical protein